MKKLFIFLTLVAFSNLSNAQYYFTVKSGGGISLEDQNGLDLGIAMAGSVGYKHQISERMYLAADLGYDGRVHNVNYFFFDDERRYSLPIGGTYFNIPITLQYAVPLNKRELVPYRSGVSKSYFFWEGGIHNNILLSGSNFVHPENPLLFVDPEIDEINPLTPGEMKRSMYDIGITAGFGFNFGFKKTDNRLVLGTRTSIGFLDIFSSKRVGSSNMIAATGYLGYEFNLSKRKHVTFRW